MPRAHLGRLRKMHLLFDFDGTITTADTIGPLAAAAIAAHRRRGTDLQPAWDALLRAYLADHDAYHAGFHPAEAARTTVAQETRFLAGLRDVERASLRRVSAAGIFAGLDAATMRGLGAAAVRGGAVALRPGFERLAGGLARDRGWPVGVVSVNWSAEFIRGVVAAAGGVPREGDAAVVVVANGTRAEDGAVCGPEALGGEALVCAPDKARAMRAVLAGDGGGEAETVYFGDSTTDLECLLGASRGVVLADEGGGGSLLATLRRLGFEVRHVGEVEAEGEERRLVWARNFDEVLESGLLDP